jgi:hypothetical protein
MGWMILAIHIHAWDRLLLLCCISIACNIPLCIDDTPPNKTKKPFHAHRPKLNNVTACTSFCATKPLSNTSQGIAKCKANILNIMHTQATKQSPNMERSSRTFLFKDTMVIPQPSETRFVPPIRCAARFEKEKKGKESYPLGVCVCVCVCVFFFFFPFFFFFFSPLIFDAETCFVR